MSAIMRVRPTKIELIRLKKRRNLAKKVHRILRERLTILVNEFLTRVRNAYHVRKQVNRDILRIYNNAALFLSLYGDRIYDYYKNTRSEPSKVVVGFENIMGIRSYTAMFKKGSVGASYQELNEFQKQSMELISRIIELGRIEQSIKTLGLEIKKTKRRVNALEYIFIPKLENTIRYLQMKFEEREREEKARLKRVKSMLEKHRG